MTPRAMQIEGRGVVTLTNADSGQSAAARRRPVGDSGKLLVHFARASTGTVLAYRTGDADVECTGAADAHAFIAPGDTVKIAAPQGFVSFLEVTVTDGLVVSAEVR